MPEMKKQIHSVLKGEGILFISPPFSRSYQGALLAPHTLQALVERKGYKSDILYLNILLASIIGGDLEKGGEIKRIPSPFNTE